MHRIYHFEKFYLLDIWQAAPQDGIHVTNPVAANQEADSHVPQHLRSGRSPGGDLMSGLRVLCLHGYHGSSAILRDQMRSLAGALPATVEFAYADAPSLAAGDFGWWHEGFDGWERSRDWAIELMRAGPRYDGIFGFSQGAALAGLLTAVHESGTAAPGFSVGFAIMAGGFTSDLPRHADLLRHKLTTPSAHIIGRSDVIVPRQDSLRLAGRFADPLVIEHPGGHIVPGRDDVASPIAEFLAARQKSRR